MRLDPKLRYLAELAARRQRRSLSSYIEWAIEDSLGRCRLDLRSDTTLSAEAEALWDVDPAERFALLALRHPDLLTHDEQILWKLIRENGAVWRGRFISDREWTWDIEEHTLNFPRLRDHWATFNAVAKGEIPADALPQWQRFAPPVPDKSGFDDLDSEIPF